MIFITFFIIILLCSIFLIIRSGKSIKHILKEIKFEIIYQYLGSKSLLEDILLRRYNRTELPKKSGEYAIVTGGSRGIGVEIVKKLMQCDMHVIIGCRNVQAGENLKTLVRKDGISLGELKCFELDTSSIKSVELFCKRIKEHYKTINVLINNAGIMFAPYEETEDGFESQFAVNYLGHYLLTNRLMPLMKAAGDQAKYNARIVNVTSIAHFAGDINFQDINNKLEFVTSEAYAQSKLAQVLSTIHQQNELTAVKSRVQVHTVHPGIVNTDLFNNTPLKNLFPWLPALAFKRPEEGATPILHAALSPKLENRGGTYISNCRIVAPSKRARSAALQLQLDQFTRKLLNLT